LILGLPRYSPESSEWHILLTKNEKLLPQAKLFLLDIALWLERALIEIEGLNDLRTSNVETAERLLMFVRQLGDEFQDQRSYLLGYPDSLRGVATDPKWTGKAGKQASFIARSFAGARWKLTSSSSREMIRTVDVLARREAMKFLTIIPNKTWWHAPVETGED
jgi:hypothetical protein